MRGLERIGAEKAAGKIRFYIDEEQESDIEIPAGTVCLTASGIYFETTSAAVISSGELYTEADAKALEVGTSGNVTTGSITFMSPAPVGVCGCVNTEKFSGGTDTESDDSLRERVLASYKTLPNGANKAYYESETLSVPGTAGVVVLPKRRGIGTVDVIVSASDGMPSDDLIEKVKERLDSSREICVDIDVLKPETVEVDIACRIKAEDGCPFEDVSAMLKRKLQAYFNGALLGKTVTRAKLGDIIFNCEGVENYELSEPQTDVEVDTGELPILKDITIEEM
jgi:uncharacterized phage protein gp47/JayE